MYNFGVSTDFLATAGVLGTVGMCWLGHVYAHVHMALTVSQSVSVACVLEARWRLATVAPSCLQGAMDGFRHWAFLSSPDVLTGLSVCLSTCHSCHAACVQSPEPVSSIPSSPALAFSVALPLPCATRKYQNVWVCTSTHASLVSGPLCLSDVPMSPFPDCSPYC